MKTTQLLIKLDSDMDRFYMEVDMSKAHLMHSLNALKKEWVISDIRYPEWDVRLHISYYQKLNPQRVCAEVLIETYNVLERELWKLQN